MYENVTYAELKGLPKEQKTEALKELKNLYKTQKELADKLGVSPNLLYNMMSRYVKDRHTENGKTAMLEVVEKPKKIKNPVKKQKVQKQDVAAPDIFTIGPETKGEVFSISIKKNVFGEDAQVFLNGIGVTLLKGQQYAIEVKITEK